MLQFPRVTVNVHVVLFPQESVAVAVTVVTPTGNVEPDGGFTTRELMPEQLSFAVTI